MSLQHKNTVTHLDKILFIMTSQFFYNVLCCSSDCCYLKIFETATWKKPMIFTLLFDLLAALSMTHRYGKIS